MNIIPMPCGIFNKNETVEIAPSLCRDVFENAANAFAEYFNRIYSVALSSGEGICAFCDNSLAKDEYKIKIDKSVTVFASSEEGAGYAFATLLQLAEVSAGKIYMPKLEIFDKPENSYRGLLIDCARSYHSVDEIKAYIDLCAFYKIRYLHLHLADDENYVLPSESMPLLTSKEKFFTFGDIKELDTYSALHNVSLVPEVDTPGHSTAMQKAYPEIFREQGIISFNKKAIDAVGGIYKEVCEMFPSSEYVHIGGDESRLGWWTEWEECREFGEGLGFCADDEAPGMSSNEWLMLRYLAYFIKCNAEAVISCGKKPIVWEGFHKATNDIVPKEVTVAVFDSCYQLPCDLIDAGYKIINCSWLPTYVVTPIWYYPREDCFSWDVASFGTINTNSPYRNGMMKMQAYGNIIGGQLSSWGDSIEKDFETPAKGHMDEWERISERLPAVAESSWVNRKLRCFGDFEKAYTNLSVKAKKLAPNFR